MIVHSICNGALYVALQRAPKGKRGGFFAYGKTYVEAMVRCAARATAGAK